MTSTMREPNPGETVFGDGAGAFFLGRRPRQALGVRGETQQATDNSQPNEPAKGGIGTPSQHQEPNQNAAEPAGDSKSP